MDNTLSILGKLVKERGLLDVASMLGHSDSQRLYRWLKKGIPDSQIGPVRAILIAKGELQ